MVYNSIKDLRIWVQKILPLVYDDSLSYYETLGKVVSRVNEMIANINELPELIDEAIIERLDEDAIKAIIATIMSEEFWVNVKFAPQGITSAKGDGVTDDTQSIQDCIDYAKEHGLALFFPEGDYLVTSKLEYNTDDISLIGCGSSVSRIISNANELLEINNANTVKISGLSITGGGSATDPASLVKISGSENITIEDVVFGYGYDNLVIETSENITLNNITSSNVKRNAIRLNECDDIIGSNIRIENGTQNVGAPLDIQACNNLNISETTFKNIANAIDVNITAGSEKCYVKFISSNDTEPFYNNSGVNCDCDVIFFDRDYMRDIAVERTARIEADETLDDKIDAETENRTNAITSLTSELSDEISARSGADTAINVRIDNLETETSGDVTNLTNLINAEVTNRETAITNLNTDLRTYIDTEDGALQASIEAVDAEVTSVSTQVNDILTNRIYNVKDFGAVGDGVTDDTQAIKDCLNKVNADKKSGNHANTYVVFPEGQYVITEQITIPAQCSIEGVMPLYGINAADGVATAGSWLYIKDETTPPTYNYNQLSFPTEYATIIMNGGCAIRNIGFYYPNQQADNLNGQVRPYRWTVMARGSNNEFTNIFASNPYKFLLAEYRHTKLRVHRIFGCPLNEGIRDIRSRDIDKIRDIHFHGNFYSWNLPDAAQNALADYRYNNLYGITIAGCDWPDVTDMFVHTCKDAIQIVTTQNDPDEHTSIEYSGVRHARFTRIKAENCSHSCVTDYTPSNMATYYNNSNGNRDIGFTDCVFSSNSHGARFGVCKGLFFENCSFECKSHGAYIYTLLGSTLVTDVAFSNCNFISHRDPSNSSTNYGAIVSGASDTMITNCSFRGGNRSFSNVHAIRIFSPATGVTACGNTFHNYEGFCLDLENESTTHAFFVNNIFENCNSAVSYHRAADTDMIGVIQEDASGLVYEFFRSIKVDKAVQLVPQSKPAHVSGRVELYVDTNGALCYTSGDNVKRTLTFT